jgi:uncharacterized phage protein (TIGR01671 family)
MRTIKFRAWDLKRKEFNDCLRMNLDGSKIEEDDYGNLPNLKNDIILMQFTDLTDKNGVEIYEGDYVKQTFPATGTYHEGEVIYSRGRFCINDGTIPADLVPECCEVVKNIYENPELLK